MECQLGRPIMIIKKDKRQENAETAVTDWNGKQDQPTERILIWFSK